MSDNLFDLQGKTYLVTGASSGIGYEVCQKIALMNGHFIAVARRESLLKQLVDSCDPSGSKYIIADLSTNEGIELVANSISQIDGIVHSAGIAPLAPVKFYKTEMLDQIRRVNYDSIVLLLALINKKKLLNANGSIVLISSLSAFMGAKAHGLYAGLKGALISIARVWANELSLKKVRVNCVSPGMVRTEIAKEMENTTSPEMVKIDEEKYPLGYGEPEDVAYPVVFLLSDAAKWITGQNIMLDGGRSACI